MSSRSDLSQFSEDVLAAERARDDASESGDGEALLVRIRASADTRGAAHSLREIRRAKRRPIFWLAAALLLLAGVAAAAYRAGSERRLSDAHDVLTAPTASARAPEVATAVVAVPAAPSTEPAAQPERGEDVASSGKAITSPMQSAKSAADADTAREVSEEAELIARARALLDAGEPDAALRSLYLHERKFQQPRLSEEREILFVRALAATHRRTEARQRLVRFTKAYPSNRAIPSLEHAVEESTADGERD